MLALTLGVALARAGAAQVAPNRNARYLFVADPGDARSIWVNPGALGLAGTLSVYADATFGLEAPYDAGSPLSQLSLGFSSHFLALAYQLDRLPDPPGAGTVRGHALRLVLWGENGRLGVGGAATFYRGGDGGTGYDAGAAYRLSSLVELGIVVANVGQPSVRGTDLRVVWRPAATIHTPRHTLAIQAQGDLGSDRVHGYSVGARLAVGATKLPLQLNARLDTDRSFRRQTFVLGLSVGGANRVAAVVSADADLATGEALSLHGVSARPRRAGR